MRQHHIGEVDARTPGSANRVLTNLGDTEHQVLTTRFKKGLIARSVGEGNMATSPHTHTTQGVCVSCNLPLHNEPSNICSICRPWTQERNTRAKRALARSEPEHLASMVRYTRECQALSPHHGSEHAAPGHRNWYGPTNPDGWDVCLRDFPSPPESIITQLVQNQELLHQNIKYVFESLNPSIDEDHPVAFYHRYLTYSQFLQVGWILSPDHRFGVNNRSEFSRFTTMLALFMISPSSFFRRTPGPWAKSFRWLHRLVTRLPSTRFIPKGIEVTGSSGNQYQITPRTSHPYYQVHRIHNNSSVFICIELNSSKDVVFGDILVALTLSLVNDTQTALQIHTLAEHIFGRHSRPRLRDNRRNLDHLFARAHGRVPLEFPTLPDEEDPDDPFDPWRDAMNRMRFLQHRFQTRLPDWYEEEE